MRGNAAFLLIGLFVGTSLIVGCAKSDKEDQLAIDTAASTSATQYNETKTGEGLAKVVEISDDKKSITLDHGQIGDMMEPMVMPFDIRDTSLLNGISVGDSIRFSVIYEKDAGYTLTSVNKL